MNKRLSITASLLWIVVSTLLISGSGYLIFHKSKKKVEPFQISTLIQTGSSKEPLKSVYLAQLMGLSADRPTSFKEFNIKRAQSLLINSPLIRQAKVKLIKPDAIYVEYKARYPIAWVYDYVNVAIDEEGFLFPVYPFFSPKKIPELYFGLSPFGKEHTWGKKLNLKEVETALHLLKLLSSSAYRDLFQIKRIDLSNAFASSLGTREIVLHLEDQIILKRGEKETRFIFPRFLRLSKHYAKELGNYLSLREKLLQEERKEILKENVDGDIEMPVKVIDLRIRGLGFIKRITNDSDHMDSRKS